MKFKLVLGFIISALFVSANFAQTDIQIKKKTSRTMSGMDKIPTGQMAPEAAAALKKINETQTTVYLRKSQMRTDVTGNMLKPMGGFESFTSSTVIQCDKQRVTTFDTKSKKYYQYSMNGQTPSDAKSGGSVTITGSVTDTGERAKLFGYDARRLKQTYIFTPSANACLKGKMQMEVDGWYADIPEFSCPMKMALPENMSGEDCLDNFSYQIKGELTGIALKEVKKITLDGQTITIEEEATAVNKVTLPASFFEPPTGYKAGNTSSNSTNSTQTDRTTPSTTNTPNTSDTLSLPSAALEKQLVTEKKAGTIRVGIAIPKVITPESKKDPNAGTDIGIAVTKSLLETLRAENVEPIELTSDAPESECAEKRCDYIFYAHVTQKRGGGGMFKSMILMGAAQAAGMMVPGIGGMIASTVGAQVMGQTMGKTAKAKDEFTLEYKAVALDKTVLSQGTTKNKTKEDGEDVLTPQLQAASKTVLGEIAKKAGR